MQSIYQSSSQVNALLDELTRVVADREASAARLDLQLRDLEAKEKSLQKRIEDLNAVPIPAAEHFAKMTELGEQRSARRDYLLFGAGVLVSTIISIVFFWLQGRAG